MSIELPIVRVSELSNSIACCFILNVAQLNLHLYNVFGLAEVVFQYVSCGLSEKLAGKAVVSFFDFTRQIVYK